MPPPDELLVPAGGVIDLLVQPASQSAVASTSSPEIIRCAFMDSDPLNSQLAV
jgi:hypothetical protein